jgi:hypothetical protein
MALVLNKKYKLASSENFDEVMKALGKYFMLSIITDFSDVLCGKGTVAWVVTSRSADRARRFGRNISSPSSEPKSKPIKKQVNAGGRLIMLKMEAICYSETSGYLRNTERYNPEDRTVHSIKNVYVICFLKSTFMEGGI